MKNLEGKVAAITGASSGIGRALAVELAKRGCHLAICSHSRRDQLEETAGMAMRHGVRVSTSRVDVADRKAVQGWADQSIQEHGRVHLVINNAGVAFSGTVEGAAIEDYEWVMGINYWGVVYGTKAFLPHLLTQGEGHIVNISSVFGLFAQPGMSAYNSSKFAVRAFTESLRQELEIAGNGVSATCVYPGGVKTNIAAASRMSDSISLVTGSNANASRDLFSKFLHMRPEDAAAQIVRGIQRNSRRVVIGIDAKAADRMQRAMPDWYQGLVSRGMRVLQQVM